MFLGRRILSKALFVCAAAWFSLGTAMAQNWVQLAPSGTPPSARYEPTTIYDTATSQMIMFGGSASGTDHNDLWSLSLGGAPS